MNAYGIYKIGVGFLRCLSLHSRQCEGLGTWDKRQVQFPRFFIVSSFRRGTGKEKIKKKLEIPCLPFGSKIDSFI